MIPTNQRPILKKLIIPVVLLATAAVLTAGFVYSLKALTGPGSGVTPSPAPASSPALVPERKALVVDEELEDVSFCGEVYKTKQIYINGVNVIQEIARIASNKPENLICENVSRNASSNNLNVTYELLTYPQQKDEIYVVGLNSLGFFINADTGMIAIIGAFDDTIIGSIED